MVNVSSVSGLSGAQSQLGIKRANEKLQAAIASLVSGERLNKASDDVAALSVASQLQSKVSNLRQVTGNLAQASSLSQVADGGAQQIHSVLERLKNVAQQASNPTLNADNRKQLNQEFQQLKAAIDRFADDTTFNNKKLLDGSLTGEDAISLGSLLSTDGSSEEGGADLEIDSLFSSSLFSGQDVNVLSADAALQAVASIDSALGRVTSVRADIGSFQQSVNYAAASVETAVINQEAARSILQDTDFAEASTQSALAKIQRDAGIAVAAQGNRLSPVLLKLVG